ncbi:hypothetical protein GGD50_006528 [Rhizobium paranaense]|uniref:Uncharacterized protein n=1 Tax=Rhizobium paranaense TaxID=1650438 RepID=A0A7W8XYG3_9HYPH|nr:hypothetical protein [Rhizobium paranaense]
MIIKPACSSSLAYSFRKSRALFVTNVKTAAMIRGIRSQSASPLSPKAFRNFILSQEFFATEPLLPSQHSIEKIGLAARALARRRAEQALISNIDPEKLQTLDDLLVVDAAVGQTRFQWLKSAPDAQAAGNLVGLTERIVFLRNLRIDPHLQARIPSGRWDQMVREGDVTPPWLANDFNVNRRRATIVAQIIKLGQKLTDGSDR